jgi:hypothetical protein
MAKPTWWKPLWIVSALGIIISALVLFPHQFLAAGSLSLILLITVVPATGGLIGYIAGKRKYPPVSVA